MSELLHLRAQIESAEVEEGVVQMRLVPFGQEITHMGRQIHFTKGSIRHAPGDHVPVNLEHMDSATARIGLATSVVESDDALYATVKISDTSLGRDTYTLLRDGVLTDVSAGVILDGEFDDGPLSGQLDHIAITAQGAFGGVENGSKVLSVLSASDDAHGEGSSRVSDTDTAPQVVDANYEELATEMAELRKVMAENTEAVALSNPQHRGHEYQNIGEVMQDVIAFARQTDPGANERLTTLIDAGAVAPDGSAIFAFDPADIGNSIGHSTPNNVYIGELLELLREGRPTADLFQSRQLPQEGNIIQMPAVSQGGLVGYMDGQSNPSLVEVPSQVNTWILTDFPKATMAGGQGVTIQAQRWSNPSYMDEVIRDLFAAYGEFLNDRAVNGDPATDTPVSGTGYTGILNAGATAVPVGGTGSGADIIAVAGTAWAAVYAGSKRNPIAWSGHSDVWGLLLDSVDAEGRPLVTVDSPSNPAGIGDVRGAGTFRGLPFVLDDAVPNDSLILGSYRDALLFEDNTPVQISLTYPDALVTDVSVYGFSSLAIRRPGAFAVMTGIVVP